MNHWYAVRIDAPRWRWAQTTLDRAGWATYIPTEERRATIHRAPRRYETRCKPVLAGYCFVGVPMRLHDDLALWAALSASEAYRGIIGGAIRMADGSYKMLPYPIPLSEVQRMAEEAGQTDTLKRAIERYKPGQKTRLTEGAYEGLAATVLELRDGDRYRVEINLLGALREVEVGHEQMEAG